MKTRARALGTERLGSRRVCSKGYLRNGLKLINLIHIADIALIISFLYEKWD